MPPPSLVDLLVPERAFIFRITHRDNVPYLLRNGVHCRNSTALDPDFVEIGHPEIIDRRKSRFVGVRPGGTLADYVPFYFTPCTPMLYNIVTGWKGLRQRARSEIVVLVTSLTRLEDHGIAYVVADRNATLVNANLMPGRELIAALPWEGWRARDFKHDPNDPAKVERYQAEALVHRVLPAAVLQAIITYDAATQVSVKQTVTETGLSLPVHVGSNWYP